MNTPETDELIAEDCPRIYDDYVYASAYWRMVELARDLERKCHEKDEALLSVAKQLSLAMDLLAAIDAIMPKEV